MINYFEYGIVYSVILFKTVDIKLSLKIEGVLKVEKEIQITVELNCSCGNHDRVVLSSKSEDSFQTKCLSEFINDGGKYRANESQYETRIECTKCGEVIELW